MIQEKGMESKACFFFSLLEFHNKAKLIVAVKHGHVHSVDVSMSDTCRTHGHMGRTLTCGATLAWPPREGHTLHKKKNLEIVARKHITIISKNC